MIEWLRLMTTKCRLPKKSSGEENGMSIVRLADGTVGNIDDASIDYQDIECFMDETITVYLYDENGNEFERTGKLVEIIEANA